MIPIRKTVRISNRMSFRIPLPWREELNLTQGRFVKIRIQNNSILINVFNQYTTEITSTIGEGGQIYIPTEVRNYFILQEIERFKVFIDKTNKYIILKPFE
ncbi:hypothetical protein SPD48_08320 [Pseudogracilibacillus sp. SE30717A]|uniref:AbrB/MazE/SpoVT family DNA-binding domain-containing protein n=1 Tax=Pseudogracilibacillus sp. SE30717A TaxID=3098293 RepID=UPI00300E39BF